MSQWQIVTDATTAAVESEGSALEENEKVLDSITGNVGTMAYENNTSYSSATEVNTALSNKADKTAVDDLSRQTKTVAAALVDLNTNKADKSTTYTKSEIDAMIGDIETLLAAI